MTVNRRIILAHVPEGKLVAEDFALEESAIPEPGPGQCGPGGHPGGGGVLDQDRDPGRVPRERPVPGHRFPQRPHPARVARSSPSSAAPARADVNGGAR